MLRGAFHRLIYCVLVCLCAIAVYWMATPLVMLVPAAVSLPALLAQANSYSAGPIVAALVIMILLTELCAIGYYMVRVRKQPRIAYLSDKNGPNGHFKITGRISKPASIERASKNEICAFENMNVIRRKLNLPGDTVIDFLVEDAAHLNAYTLGIETPRGGRHVICMTSTMIETMPTANTAAVIGHEIGHIICRDCSTKLFIGCFRSLAVLILFMPIYMVYFVASILCWFVSLIPLLGVVAKFLQFLLSILTVFIRFLQMIALYPAHLYERYISRKCEFMADAAASLSVGPTSICRALYMIGRHEDAEESHLLRQVTEKMRVINATHPLIKDRIAAIRNRVYPVQAQEA